MWCDLRGAWMESILVDSVTLSAFEGSNEIPCIQCIALNCPNLRQLGETLSECHLAFLARSPYFMPVTCFCTDTSIGENTECLSDYRRFFSANAFKSWRLKAIQWHMKCFSVKKIGGYLLIIVTSSTSHFGELDNRARPNLLTTLLSTIYVCFYFLYFLLERF